MQKRTLARHRLDGAGWSHPYGRGPFSPTVYADGGGGDGSGSGSGAGGDGGSGSSGQGGTGAAGQGSGQGGQPSGQSGSQPGSNPDDGRGDGGEDVKSLPDWAQKLIGDARAEAGKARTVAKQNAAEEARKQLAQDIGKALGIVEGGKAPTPEELTTQLRESQSQITTAQEDAAAARIELHVYRTAHRLGADADALLDSRSFAETIDSIDPSGKTPEAFNAEVETAITKALTANPQLRAGRVPRRGGGDFAGGPGTERRPTSLHDAIAAKLGG